ncbi:hypothetical protein [Methylorubrum extorquens]|uniref:hypothetical protein n=1 Tax=Methylorubrum extorquens TaxID=408 RepID=UPI002237D742|nr:hypothetical protein [Methylorubrum extorquens]UYW32538.1 hypothetical protein OKB92_26840 [Methylorubrum extorquens]
MDPSQITTLLTAQLEAIRQAPIPFVAAIAATAVGEWVAINYLYKNRIESLEAQKQLKADEAGDYKRKLAGATPDEAKEKIEAMQLRLQKLENALGEVEEADFAKVFGDQL